MVLAQLGGSISRALQQMSNATVVDEKVLNECLNEISRALLQADVQFRMVRDMQTNIKKIVNLDDLAAGHNKRRIIQQSSLVPICADCKLDPYYMESDPVKIAVEGVERFKKENCDLIIVDTSGRHKQEAALFEEMWQVSEATKPDLVIFVMDSSIGQAAFDQAQAFKQSVAVGAVIVTKMDGHAKGGGALSAVAATKSPVIFIGTGEHMDEFEIFDVKPFVSRLLGMGDLSGLMDKIHEVVPTDQQPELVQKLSEGTFTLRLMYELYQNIMKMGPIGQVFSMFPGFNQELMPKGHEKENQAKIKRYMIMMDSMTNAELDSTNPKMNESRIMRIARGSGRTVRDVMEMIEEYKRFAKSFTKLKGKIPKNAQHMSKALPPQVYHLSISLPMQAQAQAFRVQSKPSSTAIPNPKLLFSIPSISMLAAASPLPAWVTQMEKIALFDFNITLPIMNYRKFLININDMFVRCKIVRT
ncbi:Signal recognition particle protein 1 [Carex littledalei]|uniref:signal-recognition-particle GTPase n=1 Tax=Carex littledalei TaxID=544730 RepID=A0A833QGQ4_9POAL|nr:Signal recognition particle protein 1 [Carex littledalei]